MVQFMNKKNMYHHAVMPVITFYPDRERDGKEDAFRVVK